MIHFSVFDVSHWLQSLKCMSTTQQLRCTILSNKRVPKFKKKVINCNLRFGNAAKKSKQQESQQILQVRLGESYEIDNQMRYTKVRGCFVAKQIK